MQRELIVRDMNIHDTHVLKWSGPFLLGSHLRGGDPPAGRGIWLTSEGGWEERSISTGQGGVGGTVTERSTWSGSSVC